MWNERTVKLIGKENFSIIENSKIAIIGIGGVGSYAAESLARFGIGNILLVDFDFVDETNLNRQIQSTINNIGNYKTEEMKNRILEINPECNVDTINTVVNKENIPSIITSEIDFVVDAIDMITSKLDLIEYCINNSIQIVSSLGMANKIDPTKVKISRIDKTYNDKMARSVRNMARKRKIPLTFCVAFSDELPNNDSIFANELQTVKSEGLGSSSFVPAAAGLAIGSYVVRTILNNK